MAVTRSQTRKAAKKSSRRKSTVGTRKYWSNNKCWARLSETGAPYTVCTGSKGQKGVYKKKGRKTRRGKGRRGQRGGIGSGCSKGAVDTAF